MDTPTLESLREQAENARNEAEHAYQTSEYPLYGRGVHSERAQVLEQAADTLDTLGDVPPEDRRERRVWYLKRKAIRSRMQAAALSCRSHDMGSRRPLGQPLVGSPARRRTQRNATERQNRLDERAYRLRQEADEYDRRARAAERNTAIYSDEPDALAQLRAKLAKLRAQQKAIAAARPKKPPIRNYRAQSVAVWSQYRDEPMVLPVEDMTRAEWKYTHPEMKGTHIAASNSHRVRVAVRDGGLRAVFLTDAKEHPAPKEEPRHEPTPTVPSYVASNLSGQIQQVKQRIAELEARATRPDQPDEELPGGVTLSHNRERVKVELYFPGKPSQAIRDTLKLYGFRWVRSVGCWSRADNANTVWYVDQLRERLAETKPEGGER